MAPAGGKVSHPGQSGQMNGVRREQRKRTPGKRALENTARPPRPTKLQGKRRTPLKGVSGGKEGGKGRTDIVKKVETSPPKSGGKTVNNENLAIKTFPLKTHPWEARAPGTVPGEGKNWRKKYGNLRYGAKSPRQKRFTKAKRGTPQAKYSKTQQARKVTHKKGILR